MIQLHVTADQASDEVVARPDYEPANTLAFCVPFAATDVSPLPR